MTRIRERNSIRSFAVWSKLKLLSFPPRRSRPPRIFLRLNGNATHVQHCIRPCHVRCAASLPLAHSHYGSRRLILSPADPSTTRCSSISCATMRCQRCVSAWRPTVDRRLVRSASCRTVASALTAQKKPRHKRGRGSRADLKVGETTFRPKHNVSESRSARCDGHDILSLSRSVARAFHFGQFVKIAGRSLRSPVPGTANIPDRTFPPRCWRALYTLPRVAPTRVATVRRGRDGACILTTTLA
jgi:hypothetical protein